MAVVIRMKRIGRKNRPCYRIAVADSSFPTDGRTLDNLGQYDPISPVAERQVNLDVEKAKAWVARGAKPSETVRSIFKRAGVYEGAPEPKPRTRPGRAADNASKQKRAKRKSEVASAKTARRAQRLQVKYDARKQERAAAAAAASPEGA